MQPVLAETQICSYWQAAPANPFTFNITALGTVNPVEMHVAFCQLGRKSRANASLARILELFFLMFTGLSYIHTYSLLPDLNILGRDMTTDSLNPGKRHFCQTSIMYHTLQIQTNTVLLHAKVSCQEIFQEIFTECGEKRRGILYLLGASVYTWEHARFCGIEQNEKNSQGSVR